MSTAAKASRALWVTFRGDTSKNLEGWMHKIYNQRGSEGNRLAVTET